MDTQAPAVLPPLSPINVSVSLRDQAYAAIRQMITEADIYAHADEIRLDVETFPLDAVADAWHRQAEGAGAKLVITP